MNKDDVPILTISQSRVTIWLLLITGALFCTHLILQYVRWELGFQHYTPIIARFDLDQEASVPTWFSQFLFLFAGVLLFVISIEYKRMQSVLSKYWTFLGCLFLYFSIDDGAMLHEQLNEPARVLIENIPLFNQLDTPWIFIALLMLVPFLLFFSRFLLRIDRTTAVRMSISGILFLSGALGMEVISTNYGGFQYKAVVSIEETLENLGIVLFIRALLLHIKSHSTSQLFVRFMS